MAEISQNQFLKKCLEVIQMDEFFRLDYYNTMKKPICNADHRFVLSEYGLYTMGNILADFDNNRVLSKKLSNNLLIIRNLFGLHHLYAWGYLHDEIIMELYPDNFSLFEKKQWILDNLDEYTSNLVRKFYRIS